MARVHATVLITCTLLIVLGRGQAHAQPIVWPSASGGNDHYYEFIQVPNPYSGTNNAWTTAKAAADASVFNGSHGYLVTITSQAENDFVLGLVSGTISTPAGAWLGGKVPEGWLDGPEAGLAFSYTNWGALEPNNSGQVYMNVGPVFAGAAPGHWLDDSGPGGGGFGDGLPDPVADPVIGYFVEYSVTVPEPASWLMLASGFAGLAAANRRRISRRAGPRPQAGNP